MWEGSTLHNAVDQLSYSAYFYSFLQLVKY